MPNTIERADVYESRVSSVAEVIRRQDPTLYGGLEAAGPLSSNRLKYYEQHGFLFLRQFFSGEEVASLQDEIGRVCNSREVTSQQAIRTSPEVIYEPGLNKVRSIFRPQKFSEIFDRLAKDERLVSIAQQILDSQVYLHQARLNLKPGFRGKEFYWHSDFETWHVEDGMPRMRAVSCSVLLTDNVEQNGPLMVIPGSHQAYIRCVGRTPENNYEKSLRRQEYGVPDDESLASIAEEGGIEAPIGPAGSVVFFECNTMHGSNSNISPWPRSNLFFVYNSVENALVEPFGGLKPRPEFIASRNFTPIEPV